MLLLIGEIIAVQTIIRNTQIHSAHGSRQKSFWAERRKVGGGGRKIAYMLVSIVQDNADRLPYITEVKYIKKNKFLVTIFGNFLPV
jgi:hypothetical protein